MLVLALRSWLRWEWIREKENPALKDAGPIGHRTMASSLDFYPLVGAPILPQSSE